MAKFPEDKLATLIDEYRAKFNDYPPRHALHDEDPEQLLASAIESGSKIPDEPELGMKTDDA